MVATTYLQRNYLRIYYVGRRMLMLVRTDNPPQAVSRVQRLSVRLRDCKTVRQLEWTIGSEPVIWVDEWARPSLSG
jgi:hypothetical protein